MTEIVDGRQRLVRAADSLTQIADELRNRDFLGTAHIIDLNVADIRAALASRPRKATGEMVRAACEDMGWDANHGGLYEAMEDALNAALAVMPSVSPAAAQGWQPPDNEVLTLRAAYTNLFNAHARTLRRFPQSAIPEGTTPPEVVIFDGIKYCRAHAAAPPSPAAQEQEP